MRTSLPAICIVTLAILSPGVVSAGVPCGATSEIHPSILHKGSSSCPDDMGTFCPRGDMDTLFTEVVIRDCAGSPLPAESVLIYINPLGMCAPAPVVVTDSQGRASARITRVTGVGYAFVYAECQTLVLSSSLFYMINYDYDLDCRVLLADFARFAAYYLSADVAYDYDCSGLVDLVDFSKYAGHHTH